jgi:hypothetical protein
MSLDWFVETFDKFDWVIFLTLKDETVLYLYFYSASLLFLRKELFLFYFINPDFFYIF